MIKIDKIFAISQVYAGDGMFIVLNVVMISGVYTYVRIY